MFDLNLSQAAATVFFSKIEDWGVVFRDPSKLNVG
jgi:hypothetical protein